MLKVEWDNAKAASNSRKHGITFVDAAEALRDPFLVEDIDLRENYDEERVIAYAKLDGQILVIIYTMREDVYRIISARRAEKNEQHNYYSHIRT